MTRAGFPWVDKLRTLTERDSEIVEVLSCPSAHHPDPAAETGRWRQPRARAPDQPFPASERCQGSGLHSRTSIDSPWESGSLIKGGPR
jgi:hypothetical protein